VGVAKQVERTVVIDVEETTGVVVENEEGRAVAVQTAVHGVVLGQQQQPKPIPATQAATPTVTQPSGRDEDGCCSWCSCCCVVKWTLITIFYLLFLPLICPSYYLLFV